MPGRHLGIFSGKMPERHVKISYADTSALFSERHVQMSGGHLGLFFRQNVCEKC